MGTAGLATRAYLDHNATSPLRPAAADALVRALHFTGNPSSVHAEGRAARAAMDRARQQVAASVGGEAKNVIFTSGATEALNTLLRPSPAVMSASGALRTDRLLVLATEHSAALAGGGFDSENMSLIPVDGDGLADLSSLEAALAAATDARGFAPVTVALQLANSETGVIQPVREVAALVRRAGGLFVCDAVAAAGKTPIDIKTLDVDALVMSAHKFGGPKGVGAIILNGDRLRLQPLLRGGGQERRLRSGTENVAGIVAMGMAAHEAAAALEKEAQRLAALRAHLLAGLRATRPDLVVFGENAPRLPHTLNIGVQGLIAETAIIAFDLAGVAISSGSACSSGKVKRSHVLDAMGVAPALAESALRFSLGWTTTEEEITRAIAAFAKVAARPARAAA